MERFARKAVPRLRQMLPALALVTILGLPHPAASAPTLGLAPLVSATSYASPLSSYDYTGEPRPHIGLGGSLHLTVFLHGPFGGRLHFDGAYFPSIQETYQIPDNNPYQEGDGIIEVDRSMGTVRVGLNVLISLRRRTYILAGPVYYLRTWKSVERGTLPTKSAGMLERVSLSRIQKKSGVSTGFGIGSRIGRRTTVEALINIDRELVQVEFTINYLLPLTFLSAHHR